MNLPNLLTMLRIFLIPVFLFVFYSSIENSTTYATLVFVLAGITDILDGYIARKYNMITKVGTVLDPIADKLTTFAILISFVSRNLIPLWILIFLGVKEILMILGGIVLYSEGRKIMPADKHGKMATLSFYIAILSIAFKLPFAIRNIFLVATVILHLIAFMNYFIIFNKIRTNRGKT